MYLDPGFGGMLLQVIVVVVAVGGAIVYSLRRKIRGLFTGKKGSGAANATKGDSLNPGSASAGSDDMIDTLSDEEK